MIQEKFQRFILKRTNDNNPAWWDLLDKMGEQVVEHIVKDKDQRPAQEWGPFGWDHQPSIDHVEREPRRSLLWKLISYLCKRDNKI